MHTTKRSQTNQGGSKNEGFAMIIKDSKKARDIIDAYLNGKKIQYQLRNQNAAYSPLYTKGQWYDFDEVQEIYQNWDFLTWRYRIKPDGSC